MLLDDCAADTVLLDNEDPFDIFQEKGGFDIFHRFMSDAAAGFWEMGLVDVGM